MAISPYSCCFSYPYSCCLVFSWEDVDSGAFRIVPCGITDQGRAVLGSWTCLSVLMGPQAIYLMSLDHSTSANLHHDFNFPTCLEGQMQWLVRSQSHGRGLDMCLPIPHWQAHWHMCCPFPLCLWVPGNWFSIDMISPTLHAQTPGCLSSIISCFSRPDSLTLAACYWLYFSALY